jgi:hypothetical protein
VGGPESDSDTHGLGGRSVSHMSQGQGYWVASDGKWYPPELHPSRRQPESEPSVPPSGRPVGPVGYPGPQGATASFSSTWQSTNPAWGGTQTATLPHPVPQFGLDRDAFALNSKPSAPRRRSNRSALRWGSVVVVVVLVAVGTIVAVSTPRPTWDPRVLGIVHFDEQHRGLTFKEPVKVEFLGSAQFDKQVSVPQPTSKADRSEQRLALSELRALGLVHGNVNLATSENNLNQSDVVGLYVDDKKTVFVRGTALTPYVRVTLAHELTHALQDQYFDLQKLDANVKNGDDDALTALIEGDAVRDQNLYQQSLSPADQQLYQNEQNQFDSGSGQAANVPEILSDIQEFPYAFGPTFVDSLDADGGTAAIDHAFRDPPVAEAQIVDPAQYPIGWTPARVATPALPAGQRKLDTPSSFGQVSLFEVLGSRLGYDQAWSAVQGWQGDNSVPYKDHGQTCIAIDVDMANPAAAANLDGAAQAWARAIPGATVTQHGTLIDLRSCDPGANGPVVPTITPSAFDVLSARSAIIDEVMTSNQVDFPLAKCVADKVLVGVGPSGYGELTANNLSASQQTQLEQLAATSASNCQAEGVH